VLIRKVISRVKASDFSGQREEPKKGDVRVWSLPIPFFGDFEETGVLAAAMMPLFKMLGERILGWTAAQKVWQERESDLSTMGERTPAHFRR
jgi:hypothetical protein